MESPSGLVGAGAAAPFFSPWSPLPSSPCLSLRPRKNATKSRVAPKPIPVTVGLFLPYRPAHRCDWYRTVIETETHLGCARCAGKWHGGAVGKSPQAIVDGDFGVVLMDALGQGGAGVVG